MRISLLIIAIIIWCASLAGAACLCRPRRGTPRLRVFTPKNVLLLGTFAALTLMLVPYYYGKYTQAALPLLGIFRTIAFSLHHALRALSGDGGVADTIEKGMMAAAQTSQEPGFLTGFPAVCCSVFAVILQIFAPLMALTLLLSLFSNLYSYLRYLFHFNRNVSVFTSLNERSLALAASMAASKERPLIIFTNALNKTTEDMLHSARTLGALCFKADVSQINLRIHHPGRKITFFAIDEEEGRNTRCLFDIIKRYRTWREAELYVFTSAPETELIVNAADKGRISVRCINDMRSIVYWILCDMADRAIAKRRAGSKEAVPALFDNALPMQDGVRQIGLMLVGLGKCGAEMLKALTWFCQIDGYRLSVEAFDEDPAAASRFTASCPELMDSRYNGVYHPGEAQYRLAIHGGVDVGSNEFVQMVKALKETTYIFVSLGDDEKNIRTALMLRTLCEQMGIKPRISAIVWDSDKRKTLSDIRNFSNEPYDIEFVGDLNTVYSEKAILFPTLQDEAEKVHSRWNPVKQDFFAYEYYFRSSMASALHRKAREACGIPYDPVTSGQMEHRRWNAYMRSEGYIYGEVRNDLGRIHPDLVMYDALPEEKTRKDQAIAAMDRKVV